MRPPRASSAADIIDVQKRAGYLIVEDLDDGVSVYRLLHETLAAVLKPKLAPQVEFNPHERTIARTLLGLVPQRGGKPDWAAETRPYFRKHLGDHARAGNLLGELLEQPGYLLMADVDALMAILRSEGRQINPDISSLYLRTVHMVRDRPAAEAASYLEMAGMQVERLKNWAARLRQESYVRRWSTEWADWTPLSPHRVIETNSERIYDIQGTILNGRAAVLTGGLEGGLLVFDVASGKRIPLPLSQGRILDLSVVQDDEAPLVAALTHDFGEHDSLLEVWNLKTCEQVCQPVKTPGTRVVLVRHKRGLLLATWGHQNQERKAGRLQMWRITGKRAAKVDCRAVSPFAGGQTESGGWVASDRRGVIRLYSIPELKVFHEVKVEPRYHPRTMLLLPRKQRPWFCLADKTDQVRFGDEGDGLHVVQTGTYQPPLAVGLIDETAHLFVGGQDELRIYVEGRNSPAILRGQRSWTEGLALVSHGGEHHLVSADDGQLRVWEQRDWQAGEPAQAVSVPTEMIPDPEQVGKLLIAAGSGIRILRTESSSAEDLHRLNVPATVERLAAGRILGKSYLAVGFRGGVEVVDRATGGSLLAYRGGNADRTMAVALTELQGTAFAAAVRFPQKIEMFNLARPGPPQIADVPRQLVYAAAFAQLGKDLLLVAGGDGGWIQLLNPFTAKPLSRHLRCGNSVETLAISRWEGVPLLALVAATAESLTDIEVCGWNLLTKRKVAENIRWHGTATALTGGMLFGLPVIVLGTTEGLALFRTDGGVVGEVRLDAAVVAVVFEEPARLIAATTKGLVALDWLG